MISLGNYAKQLENTPKWHGLEKKKLGFFQPPSRCFDILIKHFSSSLISYFKSFTTYSMLRKLFNQPKLESV